MSFLLVSCFEKPEKEVVDVASGSSISDENIDDEDEDAEDELDTEDSIQDEEDTEDNDDWDNDVNESDQRDDIQDDGEAEVSGEVNASWSVSDEQMINEGIETLEEILTDDIIGELFNNAE